MTPEERLQDALSSWTQLIRKEEGIPYTLSSKKGKEIALFDKGNSLTKKNHESSLDSMTLSLNSFEFL